MVLRRGDAREVAVGAADRLGHAGEVVPVHGQPDRRGKAARPGHEQTHLTVGERVLVHAQLQGLAIAAARGRLHDYAGIPLTVTYHPAYLLRTLMDKAKAWEDLCFMRRTMRTQKDR